MFYVGIDIASQKHDCCILDESAQIISQFQITNTAEGFRSLYGALKPLDLPENIKIGLEATGIYSTSLVEFLRCKGFKVCTFNPLQIKKRLSATTLRKTKTDKSDARFLAHTVMSEAVQPDTQTSYHISELKALTRFRSGLVKSCSKIKVQLRTALTLVFPEFLKAFSDPYGTSARAVLKVYPTAHDLGKCRVSSLERILSAASRGRLGRSKAEELKELAKHSVGIQSQTIALSIRLLLEQMELLQKQIELVEGQIKEWMKKSNSTILSVPGIGYILGATILAEIGDIRRFDSAAKLLAFAGMEPSIYQSGNFQSASGKMVKRGSPYLRYALGQAARSAAMFSRTFREYLDKKLSENKHYNVACSHVAKKLVRVLFALLSKNSVFNENLSAFEA